MNAARDELDRDLAKNGVAEEGLRDAPRFKDRLMHACFALLLYGAKLLLQAFRDHLSNSFVS